MLDDLLRDQLGQHQKKRKAVTADNAAPEQDLLDKAAPYHRWAVGVRTLARLRYLALKKQLLVLLRQQLEYDVSAEAVQQGVLDEVRRNSRAGSRWPFLLARSTVYLTLCGLLLAAAIAVHQSISASRERAVFKHRLPEFTEQVYTLKAMQARLASTDAQEQDRQAIAEQSAQVDSLRAAILNHFDGLACNAGSIASGT